MPKKWFDIECQVLKEKTKQFANLKHQKPCDKSLLQKQRNTKSLQKSMHIQKI